MRARAAADNHDAAYSEEELTRPVRDFLKKELSREVFLNSLDSLPKVGEEELEQVIEIIEEGGLGELSSLMRFLIAQVDVYRPSEEFFSRIEDECSKLQGKKVNLNSLNSQNQQGKKNILPTVIPYKTRRKLLYKKIISKKLILAQKLQKY